MKNLFIALIILMLSSVSPLSAQVDRRVKRQSPPKGIPKTKLILPSSNANIPLLFDENRALKIKNDGFFRKGGKTYAKIRDVGITNQSREYNLSTRNLQDGTRWLDGSFRLYGLTGIIRILNRNDWLQVSSSQPSERELYLVEITVEDSSEEEHILRVLQGKYEESTYGSWLGKGHFAADAENKIIFLFEANSSNKGCFVLLPYNGLPVKIQSIRMVQTDTVLDY